jgi:transcriptional regulator GlxA family with amidase domain
MSIIHKSGTFAFGDRIGGGSDRPLKSVAYHCGFGTADRMRVVFSERLGVTPRPLSRKLRFESRGSG